MIRESLISITNQILKSNVKKIDGGFLNYAFTQTGVSPKRYALSGSDKLYEGIVSALLHLRLNTSILASVPESEGGGPNVAKTAEESIRSYLPFFLLLVLTCLVLICVVIVIVFNYSCKHRNATLSSFRQKPYINEKVVHKPDKIDKKPKINFYCWLMTHGIYLVVAGVLFLIICITYSTVVTNFNVNSQPKSQELSIPFPESKEGEELYNLYGNSFYKRTIASSNGNSIKEWISDLYSHIDAFLMESINTIQVTSKKLNSQIKETLQKNLKSIAEALVKSVTESFGIINLLEKSKRLLDDLKMAVIHLDKINKNNDAFKDNINDISGQLTVIQKNIKNDLDNFCISNKNEYCNELRKMTNDLKVNTNTAEISDDSISTIITMIEIFNVDFDVLEKSYKEGNDQLKEVSAESVVSTMKLINFDDILKFIPGFLTQLNESLIQPARVSLKSGSNYANDQANTIQSIILVIGTISFLVHFTTIASIIIFGSLLIIIARKYSQNSERDNIYEVPVDSFRNEDKDEDYESKVLQQRKKVKLISKLSSAFSVIQFVFCVLLLFLGGVQVLLLGFPTTDICPYATDEKLLPTTDYLMNEVIRSEWMKFYQTSLGSNEQLQFKLPSNILRSVALSCNRSKNTERKGLYSIVGLQGMLSIQKFVNSPETKKKLDSASKTFNEKVLTEKLGNSIPDATIRELKGSNKFTSFFDQQSYKTKVEELKKPLIKLPNLALYIEKLSSFVDGFDAGKFVLIRAGIRNLEELKPKISATDKQRILMAGSYEELSRRQRLTRNIDELIASNNNFKKIASDEPLKKEMVTKIYNKESNIFLKNVAKNLEPISTQFENVIFPCDRLNTIYQSSASALCDGEKGYISSYAAFAMTSIFLSLINCVVNTWIHVQSQQMKMLTRNDGKENIDVYLNDTDNSSL